MTSLSLYPQFETDLMSNHKAIEFLLQLKSPKANGKNYIKIKPHLVRCLLRNFLSPKSAMTLLFLPNDTVLAKNVC